MEENWWFCNKTWAFIVCRRFDHLSIDTPYPYMNYTLPLFYKKILISPSMISQKSYPPPKKGGAHTMNLFLNHLISFSIHIIVIKQLLAATTSILWMHLFDLNIIAKDKNKKWDDFKTTMSPIYFDFLCEVLELIQ